MQIALVSIGEVDSSILQTIGNALGEEFGGSFFVAQPLPNPDYAYNQKRDQYLSDKVLVRLHQLALSAERLLGVIDLDLYTPNLNFIFGQANTRGKEAVIALPRLREEFYGLPPDKDLLHDRAIKEAVHELGHTFGLRHCPNTQCVMCFANSLLDVDRKGRQFCAACHRKLSRPSTS